MKVWDLRNFKEVHSYYTPSPASSTSVSQTGLLAVTCNDSVLVWKDWIGEK